MAYGHDFGSNIWGHDGIVTSGWVCSDFPSRDECKARRIEQSACLNKPGLRIPVALPAHLEGEDPGSIEIELTVLNHPPRLNRTVPGNPPVVVTIPDTQTTALNLANTDVRVRLCVSSGLTGDPSTPNGIQIFFKSKIQVPGEGDVFPVRYCRSPWQNLDSSWVDASRELTVNVTTSPCEDFDDNGHGFNAASVNSFGFKFGINGDATTGATGYIDVEAFTLETDPVAVYDFQKLELEKDFDAIKAMSSEPTTVSRMFLFADGAAGIKFDPDTGDVLDLGDNVIENMNEALRIAAAHQTQLLPSFFDFCLFSEPYGVSNVQIGGRHDMVTNPIFRQHFLDRVVKPLLDEYGADPRIYAWEVINEPEWAMEGVPANVKEESVPVCEGHPIITVSTQQMTVFVKSIADYVHDYAQTHNITPQKVTVGSARQKWLTQYWTTSNLDLYQFHWYDHFEAADAVHPEPFFPSCTAPELDKPVLVGEAPTGFPVHTRYSSRTFLETAKSKGCAGILFWSFRLSDDQTCFDCYVESLIRRRGSQLTSQ
jgi:hypothetical protein